MKNIRHYLCFFGAAFFAVFSAFTKSYIPEQTAWVMDSADIIGKEAEAELNAFLESVNAQTGVQAAVFTVPSLEKAAGQNATIEDYASQVFEKWGLGQKKEDNGVLLLVCLAERKVRIETGYGLEGVLTDTKCGLIIRNFITPEFKNGDYTRGIQEGIKLITGYATGNQEIKTQVDSLEEESEPFTVLIPFAIWFLFICFIIFRSIMDTKHGRNRRPPTGGFFMGGGFDHHGHGDGFGGGFGGGGFGGGGGGRSGGGGASGGW